MFQKSWEKDFPWVKSSDRGPNYAFCTICKSHFNVAHGAKNDVLRHSKSQGHLKYEKGQGATQSVSSFLPSGKIAITER